MTATPLLRLARIVADLARVQFGESRIAGDSLALVRDLVASQPTPNSSQVGSSPARRTITREELKWLEGWVGTRATPAILLRLRLTVEDS